jgi:carbamoyltransferase
MHILGINAYHGDASAALVSDGKLIAAAEEERFTRVKHAAGFPVHAIRYCLEEAGIKPNELTHIAIARDPSARLYKKAIYALRMPSLLMSRIGVQRKSLSIKQEVAAALQVDPESLPALVQRVEHHKAHLASSFFVSGFDQAALLSTDGLGDFASTMWGIGRGNQMEIGGAIAFPHSLGLYYTAITQYLGFLKYGDEYKVMGLAAYGQPEYADQFRKIVRLPDRNHTNGLGFGLGLEYFRHHVTPVEMTWNDGEPVIGTIYSERLRELIGASREPRTEVEKRHQNIASSLQHRLEEAVFYLLNRLHALYPVKDLCLAGGVAFNCVANGKIFERTPFERVYIQSAAGDAGLAIGSAYYVHHQILKNPRCFEMQHSYWGPSATDQQIRDALQSKISPEGGFEFSELDQDQLAQKTAQHIADGKVVGWFQGRMEWGPRALGNRSILVDPRRSDMRDILNKRIKHREPFRPFAPSILQERTADYFEQSYPSPFMLMTYRVRPDKIAEIPAPTHVDGTGRLQTVDRTANPLYWKLISEFEKLTGVPVLLNTSFNENEPIVRTPEEAINCFLRTKMDVLAIGNFLIVKK